MITEPRRGPAVCLCVPTRVYLCGFIPRNRRRSLVFQECERETLCLSEFILYSEHRAEGCFCIFHSGESFLMKCGGEGCSEEVFDGRSWRDELEFISHAIPHPLTNR